VDINEIVESGLLELYVLALTSDDERKQVEEWRKQYPDVNTELAKIEETVASYVKQFDKSPPAELKDKILKELGLNKESIPYRSNMKATWTKYAMVASVALLVGSAVLNMFFYNKWQSSQHQVALLESEKQGILADNDLQKANFQTLSSELDILKSPSLKVVALNSVKDGVEARATVYWDTEKEEVFININNLPDAPSDKQYQLWALVDGKPIDAGVMELGLDSLQKLKSINKAQTFAITLEQKGGAEQPTLEQLIVIGNV
jgi:anti-sigma-K factor RskA